MSFWVYGQEIAFYVVAAKSGFGVERGEDEEILGKYGAEVKPEPRGHHGPRTLYRIYETPWP